MSEKSAPVRYSRSNQLGGQTGPVLSGPPPSSLPALKAVLDAANGDLITPVWRNERNGVTYELGSGSSRRFVKWSPVDGIDLRIEARKLLWAADYVAVPRVLRIGSDEVGGALVTAGLPGQNAVTDHWLSDPATAVAAIGAGLRELHDTAPVDRCPFSWSIADRMANINGRAAVIDPTRWHADHRHLTLNQALARLADPPPIDRLVVCHGDACAPNTLLADDGTCSGRVDLGGLGVADRWADLAIATWSAHWNYGGNYGADWESALLDAYGIHPDPERTAYYRLLWELGP